MKRITIGVFGLVMMGVALNPVNSQTVSDSLGTSWLKISPSTRNAGMGNSAIAVADAYDQVDLNPAGLGLIGGTYVSLSQNFWAQGLSAQHLVFTVGSSDSQGFSLGVNYMNFGSISTYNVVNNVLEPTGSYSPIGFNLYAGYGLVLVDGLRVGLAGHFIYDDIQQNFADQTASVDAGLFYQVSGLSLSAVMTDLGWNVDDATLPFEVKTAAACQFPFEVDNHKVSHKITLSAEADWFLNDINYNQYGVGMEYWFQNALALRAGYQFSNIGDLTGLTGLSLGAGVRYADWQLDYALVTLGELGIANQIGLSLRLGDEEKRATPTLTPSPTPSPTSASTENLPPVMPMTVIQALPPPVTSFETEPTATPRTVAVKKKAVSRHSKPRRVKQSRPKHKRAMPNLHAPHTADILTKLMLHFDLGDIDLEPEDRDTVLSTVMKSLEAYRNIRFILIAGYADKHKIKPTAPYHSNQELSVMRAEALKKYLVTNGIDPKLIWTKGFGATPSFLDGVLQKHFNNRRIEIYIYTKSIPHTIPPY